MPPLFSLFIAHLSLAPKLFSMENGVLVTYKPLFKYLTVTRVFSKGLCIKLVEFLQRHIFEFQNGKVVIDCVQRLAQQWTRFMINFHCWFFFVHLNHHELDLNKIYANSSMKD